MRRLPILALLPLAACGTGSADAPGVPGSGSGPARGFAVADFTQVALSTSDSVQVTSGNGFAVRAEGDPGELDKLRIARDGDTLKIKRASGISFGDKRAVKVFVTMPRIVGAQVGGSGDIAIDRVDGDRFEGAVGGSGDLTIRALKVGELSLAGAGSGDITVAGEARSLKVSAAGSGGVDARHVRAESASVDLAGSGSVRADVRGAATVNLVGSGDVDLGDAARCTTTKLGSGSVRCGR